MYQLDHVFLSCDIPVVPLEYIIRAEMWLINAQLHCSNYKWQLQNSNHQAVYVRSIKANHIPSVYIKLKLISGRHLGLTYKGM
jgi:hypothetical protein